MNQFNVENLRTGDHGLIYVKEGASKDGTVFNVTIEDVRNCHSNPLKSKPADSRFLVKVKLTAENETEKPKFKSFYCHNITNFINLD